MMPMSEDAKKQPREFDRKGNEHLPSERAHSKGVPLCDPQGDLCHVAPHLVKSKLASGWKPAEEWVPKPDPQADKDE